MIKNRGLAKSTRAATTDQLQGRTQVAKKFAVQVGKRMKPTR